MQFKQLAYSPSPSRQLQLLRRALMGCKPLALLQHIKSIARADAPSPVAALASGAAGAPGGGAVVPADGAPATVIGPYAASAAAHASVAAASAAVDRQRREGTWYLSLTCNRRNGRGFCCSFRLKDPTTAPAAATVTGDAAYTDAADTQANTGQDRADTNGANTEGNIRRSHARKKGVEDNGEARQRGLERAELGRNVRHKGTTSVRRPPHKFSEVAPVDTAGAAGAGTEHGAEAQETATAATGVAEAPTEEECEMAEAREASSGRGAKCGEARNVRIARHARTATERKEERSCGEEYEEAASARYTQEAQCGRHSDEGARGDATEAEEAVHEACSTTSAGEARKAADVEPGGEASTAEAADKETAAAEPRRVGVETAPAAEEVSVAKCRADGKESTAAAYAGEKSGAASYAGKADEAADLETAIEAAEASPVTCTEGGTAAEARQTRAACSRGTGEARAGMRSVARPDKANDAAARATSAAKAAAEEARRSEGAGARGGGEPADARDEGDDSRSSLAVSVSVAAAKSTKKFVNVVNRVRKHDLLNCLVASGLDWEGRGVVLLRVREMKKMFTYSFFRVLPGERLALRVEQVKQRRGEKKCRVACIGTAKPSEDETTPPCRHFDESCGGCSVLHLRYSRQLQEKQQLLREALRQHFLPAQQLQHHLVEQQPPKRQPHEPETRERHHPQQQRMNWPQQVQQELEHVQQEERHEDVQHHVDRLPHQQQDENGKGGEELGEGTEELQKQHHSNQVAALMTPIPSPSELGFHNRSEYVFLLKNGPRIGHYHIDSPDVTDVACCPKATPSVRAVYRVLRGLLLRSIRDGRLSIFNALTGAGLLKGLLLRSAVTAGKTERVLVCFICQQIQLLPAALSEVTAALATDSRCANHVGGIVAVPMKSPGKPARAEDEVVFFGERHITQTVAGTRFLITARTSFPTHALLLEDLWKVVLQMAEPQPHHVVWDFFAGCGLFSLLLAPQCKHVFAFDPRAENVAELRANCEQNGCSNATVHLAELSCRHTLRALAAVLPTSCQKNSWNCEEETAGLQQQLHGSTNCSSIGNTNRICSGSRVNSQVDLVEPASVGRYIFSRWGIPPTLADPAVIKKKDKGRQEALAQEALHLLENEEAIRRGGEEDETDAPFHREGGGSLWDEETDAWTAGAETVGWRRDGAASAGGRREAIETRRAGAVARGAAVKVPRAPLWRPGHALLEGEDSGIAERPEEHARAQSYSFRHVTPPDLLLVQPSRLGCEKALRGWMRRVTIPKIIYLSRYPPSMLRDISPLAYLGYTLNYIQPLDMFPHTANLMCVALLTHSQAK